MILLQALQWFWSNPTQSTDQLFKVEVAGISFQKLISSLEISFRSSSRKKTAFSLARASSTDVAPNQVTGMDYLRYTRTVWGKL